MKQFLALILIVSHVLINVVWASSHMVEDFEQHAHETAHLHLSTLLSMFSDNADDELHEHDDEAHIHLILYISDVQHFVVPASSGQNLSDIEIPFVNIAVSPPVPPPTA